MVLLLHGSTLLHYLHTASKEKTFTDRVAKGSKLYVIQFQQYFLLEIDILESPQRGVDFCHLIACKRAPGFE